MPLHAIEMPEQITGEGFTTVTSRRSAQSVPWRRRRRAASESVRRPPSAADARHGAGIHRRASVHRAPRSVIQLLAARIFSASSVGRTRSSGWRPPAINCWVCAKNSISRMPPRPTLTLWSLDGDFILPAKRPHLPFHVMDIGQRGEIQMLAPDERRDLGQQGLAGLEIAGARKRLDHCRALPCAPLALIVMQRRRGRDRHRR